LILILFMLPIFISCLLTTLAYIDVDEFESNNQPPTCKQTFIYINISTHETWNMFCCIVTYLIIFINFILLIKIQWSIKVYRKKALKSLTEAVLSTRNDTGSIEQVINKFDSFLEKTRLNFFRLIMIIIIVVVQCIIQHLFQQKQ
jgi:carbon starvation protein CstA